ncbi:MAG TPA: ABC transporter permease, partial [Candidatus Dormibacteraeota bacterium]|nr:ABC transporter permease [Candidatus Dormibacteraeota bacterium]
MIPLLWRRGAAARLGLGILALALGTGVTLGTQLAANALRAQAAAAITQRAGRSSLDVTAFDSGGFTGAAVRRLAELPQVAAVGPLQEKAVLARLGGRGYRQVLVVVTGPSGVALRRLPMVAGHPPRPGALFQVAVSQALTGGVSAATGVLTPGTTRLGNTIGLTQILGLDRFRVVGIVADSGPGAPFANDAVYVSAAAARRIFNVGLRTPQVAIRLRPGASLRALERALPGALPTTFVVSNPRGVPAGSPIAELRPVLTVITALSLVLALVVIGTALNAAVGERRREIGLVRVAGAPRRLVFRSFLREATAVTVLGALLGVGVAYALAAALIAVYAPPDLVPRPAVGADWPALAVAIALTLVVGVLAAALPAIGAARVPPLEATRPPL